ncbi:hypothetical protein KC357_g192 [Hortaea werneckii]|nr:hypothetical protein KC357_g192 [Hortaea werneckii]
MLAFFSVTGSPSSSSSSPSRKSYIMATQASLLTGAFSNTASPISSSESSRRTPPPDRDRAYRDRTGLLNTSCVLVFIELNTEHRRMSRKHKRLATRHIILSNAVMVSTSVMRMQALQHYNHATQTKHTASSSAEWRLILCKGVGYSGARDCSRPTIRHAGTAVASFRASPADLIRQPRELVLYCRRH